MPTVVRPGQARTPMVNPLRIEVGGRWNGETATFFRLLALPQLPSVSPVKLSPPPTSAGSSSPPKETGLDSPMHIRNATQFPSESKLRSTRDMGKYCSQTSTFQAPRYKSFLMKTLCLMTSPATIVPNAWRLPSKTVPAPKQSAVKKSREKIYIFCSFFHTAQN